MGRHNMSCKLRDRRETERASNTRAARRLTLTRALKPASTPHAVRCTSTRARIDRP